MQELDKNRMPEHIAIICDGNGRWAKRDFSQELWDIEKVDLILGI